MYQGLALVNGFLARLCDHATMTIVMEQTISKSQFKAKLLQYLRVVQKRKQALIITHGGKPVVKVVPYKGKALLDSLRKSVLSYQKPTEPVSVGDWETLD